MISSTIPISLSSEAWSCSRNCSRSPSGTWGCAARTRSPWRRSPACGARGRCSRGSPPSPTCPARRLARLASSSSRSRTRQDRRSRACSAERRRAAPATARPPPVGAVRIARPGRIRAVLDAARSRPRRRRAPPPPPPARRRRCGRGRGSAGAAAQQPADQLGARPRPSRSSIDDDRRRARARAAASTARKASVVTSTTRSGASRSRWYCRRATSSGPSQSEHGRTPSVGVSAERGGLRWVERGAARCLSGRCRCGSRSRPPGRGRSRRASRRCARGGS